MRLVGEGRGLKKRVLEAFDHDRLFHESAASSDFTFRFQTLDEATRKALKDFLEPFYTSLLKDGFPPEVHGGPHKLDRMQLLDCFDAANPRLQVCPACDGQKPSMIEQRSLADADHYLPKSLYPFLCVHPLNLVPTCLECNQRVKKARDPVDQHADAPLAHTFLPYVAPALGSVDIRIRRNSAGVPALTLVDQAGMPSRRLASLDRVFELEARWKDRLRQETERVLEDVMKAGRRLAADGTERHEARLRREIELDPDEVARRLGKQTFMLVQAGYRDFAVHDPDELAVLLSYFQSA